MEIKLQNVQCLFSNLKSEFIFRTANNLKKVPKQSDDEPLYDDTVTKDDASTAKRNAEKGIK